MNPLIPKTILDYDKFLLDYGTEEQCHEAIANWRWPSGYQCPKCGWEKYCLLTYRGLYQCYKCRRQTSITAGTIFAATNLPLTTWFKALWMFNSAHFLEKKLPTAMDLCRKFDISYNAARRLRKKLLPVWEAGEI